MNLAPRHFLFLAVTAAVFFGAAEITPPAHPQGLSVPPDARAALDKLYGGDADGAVALAREFQKAHPDHPLGLLLEGEALWWKRYCGALEIKYGMVEAWKHAKEPGDEAYLAMADHAIQLAQAQLAKAETAEMHFYAGMGGALKVRVLGLRNENRAAAHAAVAARTEMMRALALDPQMADATAALGLYNYYVDTLSPIVKVLRFFMGIPGGNKETGVAQMKTGMERGVVLNVDVRFILARALRQYDQKYQEALDIAEPLVERYPHNPEFLLLLANLNAELGRNPKATEYLHTVANIADPPQSCSHCAGCPGCGGAANACLAHSRDLANSYLSTLH
ncbi:MAG TPA: tetratricopeptide repeat protein [Candidatus Limnocylindrales bacterium]|nr:tetratricopeptide repeat protein [Candidatus Limnocylindrales bacterium]